MATRVFPSYPKRQSSCLPAQYCRAVSMEKEGIRIPSSIRTASLINDAVMWERERHTAHSLFDWLETFPLNSAAVESLLKGDNAEEFCHAVEAYAQSIVSTELPIYLRRHSYSVCGEQISHLVPLPIPAQARKDALSGRRSASD
ncbi:hypothetical protein GQ600_5022 [Phytophthora cactorum]|nr:hypothetical protein GQ600_5022 [Phytophthora cactorum]